MANKEPDCRTLNNDELKNVNGGEIIVSDRHNPSKDELTGKVHVRIMRNGERCEGAIYCVSSSVTKHYECRKRGEVHVRLNDFDTDMLSVASAPLSQ